MYHRTACILATGITHGNDDKVQPTPGVREVLAEAVGANLDEHFEHEDDRENLVEDVKRHFEKSSLFQLNVDILGRLEQHTIHDHIVSISSAFALRFLMPIFNSPEMIATRKEKKN